MDNLEQLRDYVEALRRRVAAADALGSDLEDLDQQEPGNGIEDYRSISR